MLLASISGSSDVVQELLADGRIDPGIKDWHGSTALFAAVRNGHCEVAKMLLKSSPMATEVRDGFGRSLFWWARRSGYDRMLNLLTEHALRAGSSIPDDKPPADTPSTPFNAEQASCGACTLTIADEEQCVCRNRRSGSSLCRSCAEIVHYEIRDGTRVLRSPQSQVGPERI